MSLSVFSPRELSLSPRSFKASRVWPKVACNEPKSSCLSSSVSPFSMEVAFSIKSPKRPSRRDFCSCSCSLLLSLSSSACTLRCSIISFSSLNFSSSNCFRSALANKNCPSLILYSWPQSSMRLIEHSSQTYFILTRHLCFLFINVPKFRQHIAHDFSLLPPGSLSPSFMFESLLTTSFVFLCTTFSSNQTFLHASNLSFPPKRSSRSLLFSILKFKSTSGKIFSLPSKSFSETEEGIAFVNLSFRGGSMFNLAPHCTKTSAAPANALATDKKIEFGILHVFDLDNCSASCAAAAKI
mmetsp:Transcript_24360/g.36137  ORF Transcript_24360/g.36137 Transcript_24360/m.36137 type:complete len:297 (-) Transcript_24360:2064-2954(-)